MVEGVTGQDRARGPRLRYERGKRLWCVDCGRGENGKRYRRYFRRRREAERTMRKLARLLESEGREALELSLKDRADAAAALEILRPLKTTLVEAARAWARGEELLRRTVSVQRAVDEFLEFKRAEGAGKRQLQALRYYLGNFCAELGHEPLGAVDAEKVTRWLAGLGVGPLTRNHYRGALRALWNYGLRRGWCERNVVLQAPKARVVSGAPEIYTPQEARALLMAARSVEPQLLGYLGLGLFAGIRPAELRRLVWGDVLWDRGYVEVAAAKAKTASRRLVRLEPNLVEWLVLCPVREGPVCPANWRKMLRRVCETAGVRWKANGMRHSFASYHLARGRDAAATALELGHADTRMLFAHYREVVTREAGEEFFKIRPL